MLQETNVGFCKMTQEADTGRLNLYQEEDTFENIETEDCVRE